MVRFQKLYMDLVAANGDVCIAYAAELRALGLRRRFGGIELYGSNREREVHRATEVTWTSNGDGLSIRGDFADGSFSIRHHATESGWDPEGDPACAGLSWRVFGARANAMVEFTRNGAARCVRGTGYSDWVDATRPTRFFGLSKLEWGRFHLSDGTFVFSRILTERGETWQRALSIRDGNRIESTEIAIEDHAGGLVCRAEGTELVLTRARVLHDGAVLDADRLPGAFERRVSELITGPAVERRIVGRARRSASPSDAPLGWGIAESVRFGRSGSGSVNARVPR